MPATFSQIDFANFFTFIYFTYNDTVTQLFTQTNYQCSIRKEQKIRFLNFILIKQ